MSAAPSLATPRERPIIFSGAMVRALLAGTKTQTRRIVRSPHIADLDAFAFDPQRGEWEGGIAGDYGHLAHGEYVRCPYGVPGDRLWVRETWGFRGTSWDSAKPAVNDVYIAYAADGERRSFTRATGDRSGLPKPICRCEEADEDTEREMHNAELTRFWASWRPSIYMPRWASRVTLEITDVRVEPLQAISEEDAKAEGLDCAHLAGGDRYRRSYAHLWDLINGKRAPWSSNPWVWAVSFRRLP